MKSIVKTAKHIFKPNIGEGKFAFVKRTVFIKFTGWKFRFIGLSPLYTLYNREIIPKECILCKLTGKTPYFSCGKH